MKTLSNVLMMLIGALFIVPKVVDKTTIDIPEQKIILDYREPFEVQLHKREITRIKSETEIVLKEVELKLNSNENNKELQ